MQDLATESEEIQEGKKQKLEEKEKRAEAKEKKKKDTQAALDALQAQWEVCGVVCECGANTAGVLVACPVAGMKRCATCGDIKPRLCVKKAWLRCRTQAAAPHRPCPVASSPHRGGCCLTPMISHMATHSSWLAGARTRQ